MATIISAKIVTSIIFRILFLYSPLVLTLLVKKCSEENKTVPSNLLL